ncbi:WAP four-disulfide core domain protein 2 isoform X1 [Mus pahari]|uniref:WAP four-disulfide core domain protein 2 isoform X1 n=1 Tax=Mus pahari TaxID=10093 RepID=UPI001114C8E6|nr:WAP four-disulfide core domain protein 2 isoform X1 [Mus pahari]
MPACRLCLLAAGLLLGLLLFTPLSATVPPPLGWSEGELSGSDTKLSETGTTQSVGLDHTTQVSTKPPAVTREGLGVREKQGTCPSVDFPKLGLCEDQCQVDSQCSGNMKCCRNGCGKMACTTPKF